MPTEICYLPEFWIFSLPLFNLSDNSDKAEASWLAKDQQKEQGDNR